MFGWFSRKKKPGEFDKLFQAHIEISIKAMQELQWIFKGPADGVEKGIEILEHEGDSITAKTYTLVDTTFIPPYEKSDIIALIQALDDIVDAVKSIARNMRIYQPAFPDGTGQKFYDLNLLAVMELRGVILDMPNFDGERIRKAAIAISDLEDQTDDLRDETLSTVFTEPKVSLTGSVLGVKETSQQLERLTDFCQRAINIIQSMARKAGQ